MDEFIAPKIESEPKLATELYLIQVIQYNNNSDFITLLKSAGVKLDSKSLALIV